MTELHQSWAARMVTNASHGAGVVSLTEDGNSIMMWSHYADSHRGFVIGLKVDEIPELKLFPVNYGAMEKFVIDLSMIHDSAYFLEMYQQVMSRKSPHWQYEREQRMQIMLEQCKRLNLDRGTLNLFEMPPRTIDHVVLGLACPEELRKKIIDTVRNDPSLSHVSILQATQDERRYELHYESVP